MKPAPFQYYAPTSIQETITLLAQYGAEAKLLAGGQSLVPLLNFRLAAPAILIDLNRVAGLDFIREEDSGISIGAMTRQRTVERDAIIARLAPLVAETMPNIAHVQIRNRGTFGGSLAHADPAAELPAVVLALDAKLITKSIRGEKTYSAGEFFTGLFSTALEPDELLVQVIIPRLPPRTGCSFQEVSRRAGDYALAGAAAVITLDEHGKCHGAKLTCVGLAGQSIDAVRAVQLIIGEQPSRDAIRAVAQAIDAEIDPQSDIHASAEFRRHLARVLAERTLTAALNRAQGGN